MARFKIISKDGSTVRYEGKPKYNGSYLKPAYLEFSEIASDFPIAWEVGDYVDYSRTGMRYRLYSVPQPSKNARRGTHGKAFTYSSVQLFSATKELEIALFRDIVSADNNIHFSSSPDVATFEDVYGIARRIEACMNDLYPGRWEIRVADFDEERDAEVIEKVNTAKDFFMSGGTCLDALSKIYELWQDIGWFHTEENGKEIITIGYSNRRIDENTASGYLYGKGNGLRAIKKNQTNREEFATRLYVYGSERNIPSRYYNSQDILNAESVDIRNLMIPKGEWGLTNGKRDARKAYLENAEAVQKYGIIPKVHYFDSDEAGADIYPSIGGMTIGRIRKALDDIGQTDYYPSYDRYPDDAERVDEILSVENPQDDGMIYKNGKKYLSSYESITSEWSIKANTDVLVSSCVFDLREEAGPCELSFSSDHKVTLPDKKYSVVSATITIETAPVVTRMPLAQKTVEGILENGVWHINLPDLRVKYGDVKLDTYSFYVFLYVEAGKEDASCAISPGKFSYGLTELKASEFKIRLKQIGFDISHQATIGKGCKVAVNTGACAGRDFVVTKCLSTSDGWELTAKRQQDDSLDYLFPNQDYQIAPGDRFVLIDIAMPDIYIKTAEDRLLSEGQKLLERASKIQNHYEPSIDAKVMHESGRSLREGMFMEITDEDVVDGATDYILIDTLGIYEDEDAIPTYKVTLKERRKVTYKGTPTAPSTESKSSSSDDSAGTQVDLSEYAKRVYVDDKIKAIAEELASMWTLDDDGNLVTEKQVVIKNNLIIHGDMASGGEGEDTPVEGASEVVIDGMRYPAKDGVIDLTEAFANVEVDLSEYYTKNEVNELIDEVKAGDIDLANYYTKSEVDAKIPKKLSALENDLNLGSFAYKNALAVSDIPDLSGKYLPKTGGTMTGAITMSGAVARLKMNGGLIEFNDASGNFVAYLRGANGTLQMYDNTYWQTIYHSGNFNPAKYLPLSGGTISGTSGNYTPLIVKNTSLSEVWIAFIDSVGTTHIGSVRGVPSINSGSSNQTLLHSGNYYEYALPLSGGTIGDGKSDIPLSVNGIGTNVAIALQANGVAKGYVNWNQTWGTHLIDGVNTNYRLGIKPDGTPYYSNSASSSYTILTSAGGTIDGGSNDVPLVLKSSGTTTWLKFTTNDGKNRYIGVGEDNTLKFQYGGASYPILHSGNVGEYNAGSADVIAKTYKNESINYRLESRVRMISLTASNSVDLGAPKQYVSGLSVISDYVGWQLVSGASEWDNTDFYIRKFTDNGKYLAWKQLAFTDSEVDITFANEKGVVGITKEGEKYRMLYLSNLNNLLLGYHTTLAGLNTKISGKNVYLNYGENHTTGLILNSSGNVTIGSSDLAGTDAKLYVDGVLKVYEATSRRLYTRINASSIQVGRISSYTSGYKAGVAYGVDGTAEGYIAGLYDVIKNNIQYFFYGGNENNAPLIIRNGNVGIGTTSPAYKLDVNGTARISGSTTIVGAANLKGGVEVHGSTPYIDFHYNNSTSDYTSRIIEDTSGRLYLNRVLYLVNGERAGVGGINSSYKFNVEGTTCLNGATTINGKVSASGGIDIPNGQQLAFLDASGNRHTIAWDSASNGILIDGNLIVLGELATGLPMQEIPSIPEIGV